MLLLCAAQTVAQNTPLVLRADPAEGGTLTGGGTYAAGKSVTVKATAAANFRFLYWTGTDDTVVSSATQFAFIKTAVADTLTAHFLFDPGNPGDPSEPQEPEPPAPEPVYYRLTVLGTPSEGGTVTGGGSNYLAGTKVTVKATTATNFIFSGWYLGDTRVSTATSYQHTTREQADTLWARFTFSPGSPGDPAEPVINSSDDPEPEPAYYRLTVQATPSEGGSVTGGNANYLSDTKVTVKATTATNFVFSGWYRSDDTFLSSATSYQYTTREQADTLQARFTFSPGSPGDPAEPVITPPQPPTPPTPTHTLTLSCSPSEGGTVNFTTKTMEEGSTTTVTATAATNFVFSGWYADDELYSSSRSFTFHMGTSDVALEARFTFSPGSPGDPDMPVSSKQYAFYLMNRTGKPGDRLHMPVYLTALEPLTDMTFRLTFPEELPPDMSQVTVSSKAQGYTIDIQEESATTFVFTLTGGNTPAGNTAVVTIPVPIPEDMPTGVSYPVRINQVAVKQVDGTGVSASTRNGRLGVNMYGDTNGDNVIDLTDKQALIAWLLEQTAETYYEEVWDVNNDGKVDVRDAMRIVEIIYENEAGSTND